MTHKTRSHTATRSRPSREAFAAAREIPAPDVAEWLGLKRGKDRNKFGPCPNCGSSKTPALHAYTGEGNGFFCHSCRASFSNIDLVAEVLFVSAEDSAAEACLALASEYGISLNDRGLYTHSGAPVALRKGRVKAHHGVPKRGPQTASQKADCKARSYAYEVFLFYLGRTAIGDDFLRSRGLDPVEAGAWGMRAIDDSDAWDAAVDKVLRWVPDPAEVGMAGLSHKPLGSEPIIVLPYFSFAPPYLDSDPPLIDSLRFRILENKAYRSLTGLQPTVPFNAPDIGPTLKPGDDVHVAEGELDAFTLRQHGLRAIGIPGTSTPWRAEWTPYIKRVGRLVVWFDPDDAGDGAAQSLKDQLATALGRTWVDEHFSRKELPSGKDVNALLMEGTLHGFI